MTCMSNKHISLCSAVYCKGESPSLKITNKTVTPPPPPHQIPFVRSNIERCSQDTSQYGSYFSCVGNQGVRRKKCALKEIARKTLENIWDNNVYV